MPLIDNDTFQNTNSPAQQGTNLGSPTSSPLVPLLSPVGGEQLKDPGIPLNKMNFDLSTPAPFSPGGIQPHISAEERVQNKRYPHYIPGVNNEDYAAKNQSTYAQLWNSLVKGGATSVGTFAESLMTIPDTISAIKNGQVDKLYNSDLESSIDNWLKNLEDKFPNYYTNWEQEHPFISALTPTGAANFWGDKLIKNLGFTIGAIGGAIAQDAAVGFLTGGVGAAPGIAAQIGKASLWLNKIFTGAKDLDQIMDAAKSAGITGEKLIDLQKLGQVAKGMNTLNEGFGGARYITNIYGAARTEGGFEARDGYNTLKTDLINEYKDRYGIEPSQTDLDEIEKIATASANVRFGINLALLSVSDAIQFDTIFKLFNSSKKGLSDLINIAVGKKSKIGLIENSIDTFEQKLPSSFINRFGKSVQNIIPEVLSEGVYEEGGQFAAQTGTYNYYHNKYKEPNKNTLNDVLKSTMYGLGQEFGSTEGWENIVLGGLTSLVTGGGRSIIDKRFANRDKKETQAVLGILNHNTLTGSFENKYKHAANAIQAQKDMQKAVEDNDVHAFKNLKHAAFFDFIVSGLENGRYDVRKEQLELLRGLNDEQFSKLFQMDPTDENRRTAEEYIDKLVEKADTIKKSYDAINRTYQNPYKLYRTPSNADEQAENLKHIQYEEWKTSLAYYASIPNDSQQRLSSINEKIKKIHTSLTNDMVSKPMSKEGMNELIDQFNQSDANKSLVEGIQDIMKDLEPLNYDYSQLTEEQYGKFLNVYGKILKNTSGQTIGREFLNDLAHYGYGINRINDRNQRIETLFDNLTSKEGREKFFADDDKLRELSDKKTEKKKDQLGEEEQENKTYKTTKVNTKDGEIDLQHGKEYILSAIATPSSQKGANIYELPRFTVEDQDENGDLTVTFADGSAGTIKVNKLDKFGVYPAKEIDSKPNGRLFLESAKKRIVFQFNFGKGKKRAGRLWYDFNNDKLYFWYKTDNGKVKNFEVTRDQFYPKEGYTEAQITASTKLSTEAEEAIRSKENLEKQIAAKREKRLTVLSQVAEEHTKTLNKIAETVSQKEKQIEDLKKSLDDLTQQEEKFSGKRGVNKIKGAIKTTTSLLQSFYRDLADLKDQRDETEFALSYVQDMAQNIDELPTNSQDFFDAVKEKISDTQTLIDETNKQITGLEKIIKKGLRLLKTLANNIKKLINQFDTKYPGLSYNQGELAISDPNNIEEVRSLAPEDYLSDLRTTQDKINIVEEDIQSASSNLETAKEQLADLQQALSNYTKEHNALKPILQKLQELVDEQERLKKFQADKELHDKLFKSQQSLQAQSGSTITGEDETTDTTFPHEEGKKRSDVLFSSITLPSSNLKPHHIRAKAFLSNIDKFSNRPNLSIILVTLNNEGALGLTGLTQSQWDVNKTTEELTNIDNGNVTAVFVEQEGDSFYYIDQNGKRISKKGENTDLNQLVFASMPTTSTEWANGETRYRANEPKEKVESYQQLWRNQRESLFKNKTDNVKIYPFDVSRGKATYSETNEKSSVVGAIIPKDALDKEGLIEIPKNGKISFQGEELTVPNGRPILRFGSTVQFLNNRNLTQQESRTVFYVLKELAKRANETKHLDKDLIDFLNGIIYWGSPNDVKTAGRNQMWIDNGKLHMGRNDVQVDFNELAIEDNKGTIVAFIEGIYNNINNYKLTKKFNQPFTELRTTDDGTIQQITWKSYQHYLLSPIYDLVESDDSGLNGKKRKVQDIPLTTQVMAPSEDVPYAYKDRYATLKGMDKPIVRTNVIDDTKEQKYVLDGNKINTFNRQTKSAGIFKIPFKAKIDDEGNIQIQVGKNNPEYKRYVDFILQNNPGKTEDDVLDDLQNRVENSIIDQQETKQEEKQEKSTGSAKTGFDFSAMKSVSDVKKELEELKKTKQETKSTKEYREINALAVPRLTDQHLTYFREWLKENIPQISIQEGEKLIRMTGGGYAWGSMGKGLITILENAKIGTEYHEAFEAVWKYFVTPTEQQEILKEFKQRKGIFKTNEFFPEKINYSEATNHQAKERIADEFAEYMLDKKFPPKTTGSKILKFFVDLYNWIKNWGKLASKSQELFEKIDQGYFKNFATPDYDKFEGTEYKAIGDLNEAIVHEIMENVTANVFKKVFSDNKSLFNLGEVLQKDLYDYAKEVVIDNINDTIIANTEGLEGDKLTNEYYRLKAIRENILANWDNLVDQNKEFLKVFNIKFEDDKLQFNDENKNRNDYDRDQFKIDAKKNASTAIKLLFATLTQREHTTPEKETDIFGIPDEIRSSTGGVKLVSFAKTFVQVMDALSNTNRLSDMIDNLVQKAKDNPDLLPLFSRLGGTIKSGTLDYNGLDYNGWRLLINFFNVFSKQKPQGFIQYINEVGNVYTQNANLGSSINDEVDSWMQNIKILSKKTASIIKYDQKTKSYKVDATKWPKTLTDKTNPTSRHLKFQFLKNLGVDFSKDIYDRLTDKEKEIFDTKVNDIYSFLPKNSDFNIITAKALTIQGPLDKLAELKVKVTNPELSSVFFDVNNEMRQQYVQQNRLSYFANDFNDISTIEDIESVFPQVANDIFSQNSTVLSKGGLFFDKQGNRVKFLKTGYINGVVNNSSGIKREISRLSKGERASLELNQNLNGWYYVITPASGSTEWLVNLGNYFKYGEFVNEPPYKKITRVFKGYLKDEIHLAQEGAERAKNSRFVENRSNELRFMKEILSSQLVSKIQPLIDSAADDETIDQFLTENEEKINEDIKTFLGTSVQDTKSYLIQNGQLKENGDGTYNYANLDTESTGLNKEQILESELNKLLAFADINYISNIIELHKLVFGDPYQFKSALDATKRIKSFLSPRGTTYTEKEYNNFLNENKNKVGNIVLKPTDIGYHKFKSYANTVTLKDIEVIGSIATQDLPEEYKSIQKSYENTNEADAQSWCSFSFYRDIHLKAGDWSDEAEVLYQYDTALARLENQDYGDNVSLRKHDEQIVSKGVPKGYTVAVIKPIASGPKYGVTWIDNILDKTSTFPMLYSTVKQYNMKDFYLKMFTDKADDGNARDYAIVISGRKIGADKLDDLYDNEGGITKEKFTSDIKVDLSTWGIQQETSYKEGKKQIRGSQVTKLATMDLMNSGVPIDTELSYQAWNTLSEQEKVKQSPLYKEIKHNQSLLEEQTKIGYQKLLNDLGIEDNGDYYEIVDKEKAAKTLQNEILRRELDENSKDAVKIDPQTGDFYIAFEASNVYQQIKSVLFSMVDKAILSPRVNGSAKVQVTSTMFDKNNRQAVYKDKDSWIKVDNYDDLTDEQKKSVRLTSSELKFYTTELSKNGKINKVNACEVYMPHWFREKLSKAGFGDLTDEELIEKLNSAEGKKILTGVGFRIPTQGLNSIEIFKVKGFLPQEMGDTVVVPSEITVKSGSDFDIDKLNTYLKNVYVTGEGEIKLVPYFGMDEEALTKFDELLDKGELFSKKDLQELDRIIGEERDDFEGNIYDKLILSIPGIAELFSPEELTKEYIQTTTTEERRKDIVKRLYKQSIENEYFSSIERLILDPHNFERLITPNSAKEGEDLRDELNEALGKSSITPSLLNRTYISEVRHNNLVAKRDIGTSATAQTGHSLMERQQIVINPNNITNIPAEERKFVGNATPILKHNTTTLNGKQHPVLSNLKNTEGKYISDIISLMINGDVDAEKDQWISELGIYDQRTPIALLMLRLGIGLKTAVFFLNQPIIREYLDYLQSKGTKRLNYTKNIDEIKKRFPSASTVRIIDERALKGKISTYYQGNKRKLSDKANAEQKLILDEFIKYSTLATHLFEFTQGINYDTANLGDNTLIANKEEQTKRAKEENLISSVDDILNNSFIGSTRNHVLNVRNALSTLLRLESPEVRPVIDDVKKHFFQKGLFISPKDKQKIGNKITNSFIDYLIQTEGGLNEQIKQLLIDEETSVALRLRQLKFRLSVQEFSDIAQNPVLQSLKVLSNNPDKTKNISLKKKGDTNYTKNIYIGAFRELRENPHTSPIYGDIVRLAILQSGLDISPISFTSLIPVEDFSSIVQPIIERLNNITDIHLFADNMNFFRNNWGDETIVPRIKVKSFPSSYGGYFTPIYDLVPKSITNFMQSHSNVGRIIQLNDTYNAAITPYPVVATSSVKEEYRNNKKVTDEMAKRGDWSFLQTTLYKKIVDENGNPLTRPDKNGNNTYFYRPINAWGDGMYAREHWKEARQSVLNNNTAPVNEITDVEIINTLSGTKNETLDESVNKLEKTGVIKKNCN